ncbi:MAG: polysaccharide biosynthesis/export family protein [Candidatus Omnitrophica bacterium]|nr:polysaccharide biosynthesis/export family protein [Candidatus Omnitrophota bacterium]MBU1870157.1 polysaccharide biosynthesis/export family protein [Candidatus Omnitrophota bacterium]
MFNIKKIALGFALMLLFSNICFSEDMSAAAKEGYLIGPDDVLDVVVLKDENLTKVVTVDSDGCITLPFLNKVKVSELTSKDAADLIAKELKDANYLLDPKVTVTVKEYLGQKVMVFGMVKKPGVHYLKGKTFALDFLNQIESTEGASGKMEIVRKNASGEEEKINVDLYALLMNGDLSQNIQILSGDTIVISRKSTQQQIYVLGEVRNPGPYTIEKDLSVLEGLRLAGGLTDFANKSKVKIIRENNGKKKTIMVNLSKIGKGEKSEDVALKAGDVLVAIKSWF